MKTYADLNIIYKNGNVHFADTIDGVSPMGQSLHNNITVVSIAEYKKLSTDEKKAAFNHELAHQLNGNYDEFEADYVGFQIFKASGNRNYNAIYSYMEKVFSETPNQLVDLKNEQNKRLTDMSELINKESIKQEKGLALNTGNTGFSLDPISGILSGIGSATSGIDSLLNGNKRSVLDYQKAQEQLQYLENKSLLDFQTAQKNSNNAQFLATLKSNQTELIIAAAIVLVIAVLFYMAWKSGRTPKINIPNMAALPAIN